MKEPGLKGEFSAVVYAALIAACSTATGGVIVGTGPTPSRTTLGTSDAVGYAVSERTPGHHLAFPYFTAQNGQMTVLHLVNTDFQNGKVVKVRIRGAGNGDSLLSFLVLLARADVWTGAISAGADGLARITTADSTCTVPAFSRNVSQAFQVDRLNPAWPQSTVYDNTREGAVEAVLVADVPSDKIYGSQGNELSELYSAIRPIGGQAACPPSVLDASLSKNFSSESDAAGHGFATPSGGMAGSWYVIDVAGSTTFSGAATAIRAVSGSGNTARGNFVLFPQTASAVEQPELYTSDPLLVSAGLASRSKDIAGVTSLPTAKQVIEAKFHDLPDLSTPYYLPPSASNARKTAGELSKLLEVTTITNQYAVDPSISAKTDWVFSMPTKRYSVGYDYSQPAASAAVFSVVPAAGTGKQYFFSSGTGQTVTNASNQLCSEYKQYLRMDREGTVAPLGPVFLTPSDPPILSCGVVSTLAFATGPSTFSSSVSRHNLSMPYYSGWMSISPDSAGGFGLPVIGGAFLKLTNPNATPGVAGNYGIGYPHQTTTLP